MSKAKILVISDVHGHVTELRWILKNETADAMFFLGDGLVSAAQGRLVAALYLGPAVWPGRRETQRRKRRNLPEAVYLHGSGGGGHSPGGVAGVRKPGHPGGGAAADDCHLLDRHPALRPGEGGAL